MQQFNPRISDGQDYLDYLSGAKTKWFREMNIKHADYFEKRKIEIDKKLEKQAKREETV